VACGLAGWRLGGLAGLERRKGKGEEGVWVFFFFFKKLFQTFKI
jgi:hypothetical protein